MFQELYYICNESALDELRRSWGEDIVSTNGTESLGKELDDMLAGEFEEATVNKWIDVSTVIFLGVDLLLLIEKFTLFSSPDTLPDEGRETH